MGSNSITGVLIRRGQRGHGHTGRMPCNDTDAEGRCAVETEAETVMSASQGNPGVAGNQQKLEETGEGCCPRDFRDRV